MTSISKFMTDDHHRCDALFSNAESAADSVDWDKSKQQTIEFLHAMKQHFTMEEEELFPAVEDASGMTQGPISVMRHEHIQMRQLFAQLEQAMEAQNKDEYLSVSETLLIMMQQHNMKEEGIIYTMCDQWLEGAAKTSLMQKLQELASE